MTLLKLLFWAIVFYYLFRFVFNFIVPVAKTTNDIRSKIKEMQNQQEQYFNNQQQQAKQQEQTVQKNVVDKNDYLDFEEVK